MNIVDRDRAVGIVDIVVAALRDSCTEGCGQSNQFKTNSFCGDAYIDGR